DAGPVQVDLRQPRDTAFTPGRRKGGVPVHGGCCEVGIQASRPIHLPHRTTQAPRPERLRQTRPLGRQRGRTLAHRTSASGVSHPAAERTRRCDGAAMSTAAKPQQGSADPLSDMLAKLIAIIAGVLVVLVALPLLIPMLA